jgi:hypothetical protein
LLLIEHEQIHPKTPLNVPPGPLRLCPVSSRPRRRSVEEQFSGRRIAAFFAAAVLASVLVPVGVEAAGPTLVKLVDGDGSSKVQVDGGRVRVGDGAGPLSVDGTVDVDGSVQVDGSVNVAEPVTVNGDVGLSGNATVKPGQLLTSGRCGNGSPAETETTLPVGTVVTSMFVTGVSGQYPNSRLDVFPGATDTIPLMSLKVYFGASGEGTHNAIYSSASGFKITGGAPWTFRCGHTISGSGTNGGLYSVFGYPAP